MRFQVLLAPSQVHPSRQEAQALRNFARTQRHEGGAMPSALLIHDLRRGRS
jgi:hypothetical protein